MLDGRQVILLLVTQPFLFQGGADARPEQNRVYRLEKVVLGAQFDAANDAIHLVQGGDDDHRNVPHLGVGVHNFQHLIAVHLGHHDVQQDHVVAAALQAFQRQSAVRRLVGQVTQAGDAPGQHVPVGLVVVDDENLSLTWFHAHSKSFPRVTGRFLCLPVRSIARFKCACRKGGVGLSFHGRIFVGGGSRTRRERGRELGGRCHHL